MALDGRVTGAEVARMVCSVAGGRGWSAPEGRELIEAGGASARNPYTGTSLEISEGCAGTEVVATWVDRLDGMVWIRRSGQTKIVGPLVVGRTGFVKGAVETGVQLARGLDEGDKNGALGLAGVPTPRTAAALRRAHHERNVVARILAELPKKGAGSRVLEVPLGPPVWLVLEQCGDHVVATVRERRVTR